ncbi:MAG: PhoU domain-containing protein [Acidilobaceae archaeon]
MAIVDSAGREILEDLWRMKNHILEIHGMLLECDNLAELMESLEEAVAEAELMKDMIARKAMIFIARFQPLGRDLLLAETSISVAYDLYRIARYFREIATAVEHQGSLARALGEAELKAFKQLGEMIESAVSTYISWKPHTAKRVIELDNVYDSLYKGYLDLVLSKEQIDSRIAIGLLVARHMERIADHATYIIRSAEKLWRSPSLGF